MKHTLALVLLLAGIHSVQAMQGEINGKKQHRGSLTDLTDLESGKHIKPMACHRRSRSNGASVINLAALHAQTQVNAAKQKLVVANKNKPGRETEGPDLCGFCFIALLLSLVP